MVSQFTQQHLTLMQQQQQSGFPYAAAPAAAAEVSQATQGPITPALEEEDRVGRTIVSFQNEMILFQAGCSHSTSGGPTSVSPGDRVR